MSIVNGKRQAALYATETDGPFAGVVLNRPVESILTYRVPSRLQGKLQAGQRVRIPLGKSNAKVFGYCVRVDPEAGPDVEPGRVKDLIDILDAPPLIDGAMLELTRWLASYYGC